jgi:hypothetical protein
MRWTGERSPVPPSCFAAKSCRGRSVSSSHRIRSTCEVLALASFRGSMNELVAVGAQPADVRMRHGSAVLEQRVGDVAGLAVQTLAAWGHDVPQASASA